MIVHDVPQNDDAWFEARLGLPTASRAKDLVTPKTLEVSDSAVRYGLELAWQRHTGRLPPERHVGTFAMRRGSEQEEIASLTYAERCDVELVKVGFVTDDRRRFGGSPDRIVRFGTLGVELKCPGLAEYLRVLAHYEAFGVPPAEYLPQVQMLMLACETPAWDLVFYHEEDPCELLIIPVRRCRMWSGLLMRGIVTCERAARGQEAMLTRRAVRLAGTHYLDGVRLPSVGTEPEPYLLAFADQDAGPVPVRKSGKKASRAVRSRSPAGSRPRGKKAAVA